jgi:ADP-heptose:LPS heptosyltransferase
VLSERNRDVFAPGVFEGAFSVPWGAWKTRNVRRDFASLLGTLRAREYDSVLVATEELAAYRLAHATGAPQRRGFENGAEKPLKTLLVRLLCTSTLYRPASLREPMHEAHVQYRLAEGLGAPPQPPQDAGILRPLLVEEVAGDGETIALQATDKWQRLGLSSTSLAQLAAQLARRAPLRILASRREAALAQALGDDYTVDIFGGAPGDARYRGCAHRGDARHAHSRLLSTARLHAPDGTLVSLGCARGTRRARA